MAWVLCEERMVAAPSFRRDLRDATADVSKGLNVRFGLRGWLVFTLGFEG